MDIKVLILALICDRGEAFDSSMHESSLSTWKKIDIPPRFITQFSRAMLTRFYIGFMAEYSTAKCSTANTQISSNYRSDRIIIRDVDMIAYRSRKGAYLNS